MLFHFHIHLRFISVSFSCAFSAFFFAPNNSIKTAERIISWSRKSLGLFFLPNFWQNRNPRAPQESTKVKSANNSGNFYLFFSRFSCLIFANLWDSFGGRAGGEVFGITIFLGKKFPELFATTTCESSFIATWGSKFLPPSSLRDFEVSMRPIPRAARHLKIPLNMAWP